MEYVDCKNGDLLIHVAFDPHQSYSTFFYLWTTDNRLLITDYFLPIYLLLLSKVLQGVNGRSNGSIIFPLNLHLPPNC
jgi:hypothetical protein